MVEVQGGGYDIGVMTLSGELVRLQMKKKYTNQDRITLAVIRRANERDIERLDNKTNLEKESMILSRAIARTMGMDIKIGDVEYQGDMKKATFYFTANGRVDFRELVRSYAKEFKVKIEMRQIGSRQESARIGGVGSCGRELCCSTWLSDFRSVNTTAARYQNIAINQTKLSGQCGRLKCCLNYELDTYLDALKHFPSHAQHIKTRKGNASLVKTDIFKGLMYYAYDDITMRGVFHPLDKEKVKEIIELNKKGVLPEDLTTFAEVKEEQKEIGFADVTGEIELPNRKSKKKSKNKGNKPQSGGRPVSDQRSAGPRDQKDGQASKPASNQDTSKPNQPNRGQGSKTNNSQEEQKDGQAPKGGQPQQGNRPQNQGNRPNQGQKPRPAQKPNQSDTDKPMPSDPQPKPAQNTNIAGSKTDDVKPTGEGEMRPTGPEGAGEGSKKNFKKKRFFNKNKNKNQ